MIEIDIPAVGSASVIVNSGLIESLGKVVEVLGGRLSITNEAQIFGDIVFDDESDRCFGRKCSVNGTVHGGGDEYVFKCRAADE